MSRKVESFKVGNEFMMDGYTGNGEFIKTKCKLIAYNGMNKYVVDNEGVTVLVDGDENAYPIIDNMVYESEIKKWVTVDEYQSYAYNYPPELDGAGFDSDGINHYDERLNQVPCSKELDNEWANESI